MKSFVLSRLSGISKSYILDLCSKLSYGRLELVLEDEKPGQVKKFGQVPSTASVPTAQIIVKSPNVWTRMSINLDLGFSEAYMLGELDCDDIVSLVSIYIGNWSTFGMGNRLLQVIPRIQKLFFDPPNDSKNALKNASSHYDTSNAMFAAFLSPDMSYSSPIWKEGFGEGSTETLEEAQTRKVHNIIEKACISKEHHVLDIGGGWCFLAIEAVKKTGCKVTATTLSVEQKTLGEKKVKEAGLEDRIEVLLCDYRKTPKPTPAGFDRVVSVEMLEHVGRDFMETYFREISNLLNVDHGIMVVQGITFNDMRLHNNRLKVDNFIDRYIFPGGYLPSVQELFNAIESGSSGALQLENAQSIGPHYAKALYLWRQNFLTNWESIKTQYVKERGEMTALALEAFKRRWIYYFAYCEAGFRQGLLGDYVITARRKQIVN